MATLLSGLWPNTRVRFLRYNNQMYAFNGRDPLYRFDGEDWNQAGFAKPTGCSVASGAAGNPSGTYEYKITAANKFIETGDGRYVEGLPQELTAVTLSSQKGTVTLPGSGQSGQTHWVIYRNKNGDTRRFFRVASVALGTTTYNDDTADDSLSKIELGQPGTRFPYERPPTFKHGCIFGNRMIGTGFDEYNSGTVTVNGGDDTLIDLADSTFPAGVRGCYFQKEGDGRRYIIDSRQTTTQIKLTESFSGALSAADYAIFRDPAACWYTEFDSMEAWGEEGETTKGRNMLLVGGRGSGLRTTGIYAAHGRAYVFTDHKTYLMQGGNSSSAPLWVDPDPLLYDVGCVNGDTICQAGDTLFWLSRRGPVAYQPSSQGGIQMIGDALGADWITSMGLTAAQLGLCAGGYDPLCHCLKWGLPGTGQTQLTKVVVYDLATGTWWVEDDWRPRFYFNDWDANSNRRLYSVVAKQIFRETEGTVDGVPSGDKTATVTDWDAGTKVLTASGAAFYTTDLGLEDRWAHIYSATGTYRGKSRITANAATTLTLADAVAGVVATDIVYVGAISWYWKSKTFSQEPKQEVVDDVHMRFALQGESPVSNVHVSDFVEGAAAGVQGSKIPVSVNATSKKNIARRRSAEYALKVEGYTPDQDIAIRSIMLESPEQAKDANSG